MIFNVGSSSTRNIIVGTADVVATRVHNSKVISVSFIPLITTISLSYAQKSKQKLIMILAPIGMIGNVNFSFA